MPLTCTGVSAVGGGAVSQLSVVVLPPSPSPHLNLSVRPLYRYQEQHDRGDECRRKRNQQGACTPPT